MTTFRLEKTMTRKLTREEEQQVRQYMHSHPIANFSDIAAEFEGRFGMPVTAVCIAAIAIDMSVEDFRA